MPARLAAGLLDAKHWAIRTSIAQHAGEQDRHSADPTADRSTADESSADRGLRQMPGRFIDHGGIVAGDRRALRHAPFPASARFRFHYLVRLPFAEDGSLPEDVSQITFRPAPRIAPGLE